MMRGMDVPADTNPVTDDGQPLANALVPAVSGRAVQAPQPTPLELAGEIANRAAGRNIFDRYLQEKSANTILRHARDLELFAEYLIDVGIPLENGADFQRNPAAWRGVTWGIVE